MYLPRSAALLPPQTNPEPVPLGISVASIDRILSCSEKVDINTTEGVVASKIRTVSLSTPPTLMDDDAYVGSSPDEKTPTPANAAPIPRLTLNTFTPMLLSTKVHNKIIHKRFLMVVVKAPSLARSERTQEMEH